MTTATLTIGAFALQPAGAADAAAVTAGEASAGEANSQAGYAATIVEDLLGTQTAGRTLPAGAASAIVVTTAGTILEVPADPSDGITVELAGSGADLAISPLDPGLQDFARDGALAVADGHQYSMVTQPLRGGDVRLAVTLHDPTAPRSLTYDLDLPEGTRAAPRPDGGFDFVTTNGVVTGGLAAPWAIDALGQPVKVTYGLDDHGRITRHLHTTTDTAYPVTTNFCIFGRNPKGSCRNPIRGSWDEIRRAASWAFDNVVKPCGRGAVVTVIGTGASFAVTNVLRTAAGKALVLMPGGVYGYLGVAATGCIVEVLS